MTMRSRTILPTASSSPWSTIRARMWCSRSGTTTDVTGDAAPGVLIIFKLRHDALRALSRAFMPMLREGEPVDDSALTWPAFKEAVRAALEPRMSAAADERHSANPMARRPRGSDHYRHHRRIRTAGSCRRPCKSQPFALQLLVAPETSAPGTDPRAALAAHEQEVGAA